MTKTENLIFRVQRFISCHHSRVAFFNVIHKIAMFVSLFAAMAVGVIATQRHRFLALGFGMVVALAATLD